jgi:pimeloyl-ACP methyl ester carboxylesterase
MPTVRSADGTTIAYERTGEGPPVVLVDGALCHRAFNGQRPLAERLADRFSVLVYDRRGRGESGDTAPPTPEREVEDLAAVLDAAGAPAAAYGISSGAALVLHAAAAGLPISRFAIYEVPFAPDADAHAEQRAALAAVRGALAAGDPGRAVRVFLRLVGVPAFGVAMMRLTPAYRRLQEVAPTLPYDLALLGADSEESALRTLPWDRIEVPALVLAGGRSPEANLVGPTRRVSESLPDGTFDVVEGQNHMVRPDALAPLLAEFFGSEVGASRDRPESQSG